MSDGIRLKRVNCLDHRVDLEEMIAACFPDMPLPGKHVRGQNPGWDFYDWQFWWIAYDDDEPCAFLAIIPSSIVVGCGYIALLGVLPAYRGHGLQRRMMKAAERLARQKKWPAIVSDTNRDNFASANNFIREGYKIIWPPMPWGNEDSIYWRKDLA